MQSACGLLGGRTESDGRITCSTDLNEDNCGRLANCFDFKEIRYRLARRSPEEGSERVDENNFQHQAVNSKESPVHHITSRLPFRDSFRDGASKQKSSIKTRHCDHGSRRYSFRLSCLSHVLLRMLCGISVLVCIMTYIMDPISVPHYTRDENLRDPAAKPARGILPADDFKGDKVAGIGPSGFYKSRDA
jgi:hypothetical protein